MCGICGVAHSDPDRPVDVERLEEMRELLGHRGPDAAGQWTGPGIGLGHRRLSVIDLAGGVQPLTNEDASVWVTFNGEIYNFRELAADLKARGHQFRTRSDTEVLVHGYEEYGLDLPRRLNGIFAFALYDTARRRLVIVRDHLGVKPIFYGVANGTLAFASEIKSVVKGLQLNARVSDAALQEYLIFRYVAHDRTFFEGVHRLPPGHMLVWEQGAATLERYWTPPVEARGARSLSDAVEELDHLLGRAVERQMMSDVPLGAFCSGGVDSGLTTRYAAASSGHPLHTFSVGFREAAWDESVLARSTADRFGTLHHTVIADPADVAGLVSRLIGYNDEPLSHPNAVPLYQLSQLARKHVTVALTGEGADELFAGYPRHQLARLRFALNAAPASARQSAAGLLRRVPGHRAAKAAELLPRTLIDSMVLNSAYVSPEIVSALTEHPVDEALATRRALAAASVVSGDGIASITAYDTMTYLGCALDRMDRMSMAVGLEARVPFLDIDLVEWALRLDTRALVRGTRSKAVVKRLAERWLDDRITRGRKSGFGLPLDDWFRQPSFAPLAARLADANHPAADMFDRPMLHRVVSDHVSGRAQNGELLWLLANVYLWYERHIDRGAAAAYTEPTARPVSVAV